MHKSQKLQSKANNSFFHTICIWYACLHILCIHATWPDTVDSRGLYTQCIFFFCSLPHHMAQSGHRALSRYLGPSQRRKVPVLSVGWAKNTGFRSEEEANSSSEEKGAGSPNLEDKVLKVLMTTTLTQTVSNSTLDWARSSLTACCLKLNQASVKCAQTSGCPSPHLDCLFFHN